MENLTVFPQETAFSLGFRAVLSEFSSKIGGESILQFVTKMYRYIMLISFEITKPLIDAAKESIKCALYLHNKSFFSKK